MKTKSLTTGFIIYLISGLIAFLQGAENEPTKLPIRDASFILDTVSIANDTLKRDTLAFKTLKYQNDSLPKKRPEGSSILKDKVEYTASDSTIYSIDGKKVYLFGDATITYEDIELSAAYIEVDMEENILYAEGVKDSLGNLSGQPVFTQDGETMQATSLTYNVKTEKGFIRGLYTEQEEGYLHSESTKKDPNNYINLNKGKYTTCELEHPHFYMAISRGKVIPNKAIVAGYSYMVVEDVPLFPIMVPFGFFPTSKTRASGFIIPKFGEENQRGLYLRQGGYYFAINDYVDLGIKGDVYSKGSWLVNAQSKYKLRYKFSGNVNLAYSKIQYGEEGDVNYGNSNQYRIRWTHTQDAKARPNSNFSANVNFTSQNENRYNSTTSEDYLSNTTSSSISYRKNFANTPFSTSMNLRHSQNNKKGDVNFTLPQMTMNMSRIFPFRKKVSMGKAKWYENIGLTYAGNFENKSDGLNDTLMQQAFKEGNLGDYFNNGIKHSIPIGTSFKLFKYFSLSPKITLTDRMYFERSMLELKTTEQGNDTVVEKIENGFYNVYDLNSGSGINLETTVYGMYTFRNNWLKAIRHVAKPRISFSYTPESKYEERGYYLINPGDSTKTYSPYRYGIYGVPTNTSKGGNIGFALNNNVEMKVANKKDTVNEETKIKLLESLNFSSSYNMMADSMNWSNISMSARTTLFKVLSITMSATGDLYAFDDSLKQRVNEFHYKTNPGKPFRITSARASTGFSLNSKTLFGGGKEKDEEEREGGVDLGSADIPGVYDQYAYDYFDIPWNVNIQYALTYTNTGLKTDVTQSLSFTGDLSLTPKWKIGFRSGYDFEASDFSYTSFNLSRDLHCWVATLSLIPFGPRQSYNFAIGAKSSVLADLKYNKNKSWIDNAY
ncbi:MAG: putative LPS assembly protein LptD [Salinivirgaceae bacterium]|nr:putative LPS assembly protein LptD [Salinivirgaceae bacterium]